MNKRGLVGLAKVSLLIISLLTVFVFSVSYLAPAIAEDGQPTIWTDRPDYAPGETALVSGMGFKIDRPLTVQVTRPDGTVESCDASSCDPSFPDGPLLSDSSGSFSDYPYALDGIAGEYLIDVSDGENSAQATFNDCPSCSDHTDEPSCTATGCYWCPSCSGVYIFNGANQCVQSGQNCSYDGCSISCGAGCDSLHPCPDTECDGSDGCYDGKYYRDYNDVPNACLPDCACENNACDDYTEVCDQACGADCEADSDCPECPDDGCIELDWYDYPDHQTCMSGCSCDSGSCTPTITYDDPRCWECDDNDDCDYLDGECADGVCNLDTHQCGQQFRLPTEVCRASAGVCDLEETCTGSSADCPADAKSTEVCRASAGVCDVAESCSGVDNDCPADAYQPLSTPCDNGLYCDGPDHCNGAGSCVAMSNPVDCSDSLYCTINERCDEGQDACLSDPRGCSENDISGIATCYYDPDSFAATFDWRDSFTSTCDEGADECTSGNDAISHNCADNDDTDGIFSYNGIQTCSAECDGTGTECEPYLQDDYCYYEGSCDTSPTVCACSYSSEPCPEPGTVDGGVCYYGERICTENGCDGILTAEMGCKDYCDPLEGPKDTQGPTTSNVVVDPHYNNGDFDTTATTTDTCTVIKTAKYYIGHSSIGSCSESMAEQSGTIYPSDDGSFGLDKLTEYLFGSYFYSRDGLNYICIKGQDNANNWGNCACAYFETDTIPPDCPYDIYMDDEPYPDEYLICGNNATLNATVCDQESYIQGGEYFIDITIPPVPEPWSGYWMETLYNFTRWDGWHCAVIGAFVNTSELEDGTHYIKLRGKDCAENWGKISKCSGISFIRDTLAPETDKELIPADGAKVDCSTTEINGETITDGCHYVKQGTSITLTATDPDPQGTGEFAGDVIIYYRVWWSYDGGSWSLDQEGQSNPDEPVTITLTKDSYHLIEYWSVDACGYEEQHHFELDIVDTQPPEGTKIVGEPRLPGDGFDWWVRNHVTEITLDCTDPQPHPVDQEAMCYRVSFDGQPEWLTDQYCSQFNGIMEGGWCCMDKAYLPYTFTFQEDSLHDLEYYCEDALGNKWQDKTEYFRVDSTPPETTKVYGYPLVEAPTGGYPKWITSSTPITLEAVDLAEPCAVGVDKTYWRNTLVDEEYCSGAWDCQQAVSSGDFNLYTEPFTKPEESCHLIEYYSVDALGNTEEVKRQCVFVENTPPVIDKDVGEPKHACTQEEWLYYNSLLGDNYPDYGCWYITQDTVITLNCYDIEPHPVDDVTLYYRDYLIGNPAPGFTPVPGGFVEIQKGEDSEHILEFYCEDALGNSDGLHTEIDIVDTQPPESEKTLGDPKHACTQQEIDAYYSGAPAATDGCHFITQSTPITLTCQDQDPHPVDLVEIHYRDYLVGETPPGFTEVPDDHVTFTKSEDSAHILEWYCVDELGNTEETHVEYDIVDTQPPETTKSILGPQYYDQAEGKTYIDGITEIELTCLDPDPHPVDHEAIYYRYRVDDGSWTSWTEYTGKFSFPEESKHELEYYCIDELGNEENHKFEIDYVDHTPPVTTKTYGLPLVEAVTGGYPKWITSQTQITLTADDGDENHDSGVKATYWRNTLVDEEYCSGAWDCQKAVGSGDFNLYTEPFTKPQESCHLIEYYSVDNVEKTETVKKQCVYVDNTPPEGTKEIGDPKITCETGEGCDYWVRDHVTEITLDCTDPQPHPVDQEAMCYRVSFDDPKTPWLTQQYCSQFGGVMEGDYCCADVSGTATYAFTFQEDSLHDLEYYCEDALGNKWQDKTEYFRVDSTPPNSIKTIGEPKWWDEELGLWWVTSDTEFTLTAIDEKDPCAVGVAGFHVKIEWDSDCDETVDTTIFEDEIPAPYEHTFYLERECLHRITWYAIDRLGNEEEPKVQYHMVDNTPPHVLILKPVDGWYSDGEDIAIVARALDRNGVDTCGEECDMTDTTCAVGIEDGKECHAYLLDFLPEFGITELETEGTLLYNMEAKECQGYATIPDPSEIPDGVVILVVRAEDRLENEAGSFAEIFRAIYERCQCEDLDYCGYECMREAIQSIVTIWNLPKIGIDNSPPQVEITEPAGTLVGGEILHVLAQVSDASDGEVTSTITSGAPCYITLGGVSLGAVPYSNDNRECEGDVSIPDNVPSGEQDLVVIIFDNAGNGGSGSKTLEVDTIPPEVVIENPESNTFVKGEVEIEVLVEDDNVDEDYLEGNLEISLDHGQTWENPEYCEETLSYTCYLEWDTAQEEEGMAYGIKARVTDEAGNEGESEVVVVIVDNVGADIVAIVDPYEGEIVEGTITLVAIASDQVSGIKKIKFYIDDIHVGTDDDPTAGWTTSWDSNSVSDGTHEIYAMAWDNVDHQRKSQEVSFMVDNEPPGTPGCIYFEDEDGDGYDEDGVVTLRWCASSDGGAGLDYYEIIISNPEEYHFTRDAEDEDYTPFITLSDLHDGEWTGLVRAWDRAGRSSGWTDEATIIIDTAPPSSLSVSINGGATWASSQGVTLALVYPGDAYQCQYSNDGTQWTEPESPVPTREWVLTEGDGTKTVHYRCGDEAGNRAEGVTDTIILDTTPPYTHITSPEEGDYLAGETEIIAEANDGSGSGVSHAEFFVDGSSIGYDYDHSDGKWNIDWDTTGHTDGSYDVTAKGYDLAGNDPVSDRVTVSVDNTPPECPYDLYHSYGQEYDTDGVVTWAWDSSSDSGIGVDYYQLWLCHDMYGCGPGIVVGPSGGQVVSYTVSDLLDGGYTAYLSVADKLGNGQECEISDYVVVDKTPPDEMEIWAEGYESEGSYYDRNGEYTIAWDGGDDLNFDYYELFENGASVYTGPGTGKDFTGKAEGTYAYRVVSRDEAGWSTTSDSISVIVDTVAPVITPGGQGDSFLVWGFSFTVDDGPESSGLRQPQTDLGVIDGWCSYSEDYTSGQCTVFIWKGSVTITVTDRAGWSDSETITRGINPVQITSGPAESQLTDTGILISWGTDKSSDSWVKYGERNEYCAGEPQGCYLYDYEQCWAIPGCDWYQGYEEYCDGTPSLTCGQLGEQFGEEKCLETPECSWNHYHNEYCSGQAEEGACQYYDSEQCYDIAGCDWISDQKDVCVGTPASCENYDDNQCELFNGCDWILGDTECTGTPAENSCEAYDEMQCYGIDGCSWVQSGGEECYGYTNENDCSTGGCNWEMTASCGGTECAQHTSPSACEANTNCYWCDTNNYCFGPGICESLYYGDQQEGCLSDPACGIWYEFGYCWGSGEYNCEGTPLVTCDDIYQYGGSDKCTETEGCSLGQGPGDCEGVPQDSCEDIQFIGENNGYNDKCTETPGCEWDTIPVEWCEGTPDCLDIEDPFKCDVETPGCSWTVEDYDYCYGDVAQGACYEYGESQCLAIDGCTWKEELVSEECGGIPEMSCYELGDVFGEDKCLETPGCSWEWECGEYTQGVHTWDMLTYHSILLTGLKPDTAYCYKIRSEDGNGFVAEVGGFTFTTPAEEDIVPPEILSTSPSGVMEQSEVALTAETNEDATCYYGAEDDYSTMTAMLGSGTTTHSADLGTLTDGMKVYHIRCEDSAGNMMEHSKTVVFYIDSTGMFDIVIPDYGRYWSIGWNTFFLPKLVLDDIGFCPHGGPYSILDVLASIDGEDPGFDVIWYYDEVYGWRSYDPDSPFNDLTAFDDEESNPYFIRMNREGRLEISGQEECEI